MQEVELGGLEDNEDNGPAFGPADDEYHLFDKEEVRFLYMFTWLQILTVTNTMTTTTTKPLSQNLGVGYGSLID